VPEFREKRCQILENSQRWKCLTPSTIVPVRIFIAWIPPSESKGDWLHSVLSLEPAPLDYDELQEHRHFLFVVMQPPELVGETVERA
jgi:hypothetical protein